MIDIILKNQLFIKDGTLMVAIKPRRCMIFEFLGKKLEMHIFSVKIGKNVLDIRFEMPINRAQFISPIISFWHLMQFFLLYKTMYFKKHS